MSVYPLRASRSHRACEASQKITPKIAQGSPRAHYMISRSHILRAGVSLASRFSGVRGEVAALALADGCGLVGWPFGCPSWPDFPFRISPTNCG